MANARRFHMHTRYIVAYILLILMIVVSLRWWFYDDSTKLSQEVEVLRTPVTATPVPTRAQPTRFDDTPEQAPTVSTVEKGSVTVVETPQDYVETQDYSNITEQPPRATFDIAGSVGKNYVLIGSDSRGGDNTSIASDSVTGQRSDTVMVVHVPDDYSRADIISIPRDTMVYIPSCNLSSGGSTSEQNVAMFNSAFSQGDTMASSIACTMRTIEANTGVRLDGYIAVDFNGFSQAVDKLGGIEVDVPHRMVSSKANLDVNPGVQLMDGETALAYARARTFEVGGGDGSDLSRIDRQHQVLNALFHKILNPDSMNIIQPFQAILNIQNSVYFGGELDSKPEKSRLLSVPFDNMNFYTTPTTAYTYDANRLMWTDEALTMWQNVHDDKPL